MRIYIFVSLRHSFQHFLTTRLETIVENSEWQACNTEKQNRGGFCMHRTWLYSNEPPSKNMHTHLYTCNECKERCAIHVDVLPIHRVSSMHINGRKNPWGRDAKVSMKRNLTCGCEVSGLTKTGRFYHCVSYPGSRHTTLHNQPWNLFYKMSLPSQCRIHITIPAPIQINAQLDPAQIEPETSLYWTKTDLKPFPRRHKKNHKPILFYSHVIMAKSKDYTDIAGLHVQSANAFTWLHAPMLHAQNWETVPYASCSMGKETSSVRLFKYPGATKDEKGTRPASGANPKHIYSVGRHGSFEKTSKVEKMWKAKPTFLSSTGKNPRTAIPVDKQRRSPAGLRRHHGPKFDQLGL